MATEADLDAVLANDSSNIEALVGKGEFRRDAGDARGAAAYFGAALKAAQRSQPLPMSMKPVIQRAQAGIAAAEQMFREHQERSLADAGFPVGRRPERFQHALDLMSGRAQTQLHLQRPTSFYLPGLDQRTFYDTGGFTWAEEVEAASYAIREELRAELARGDADFAPYLVDDPARPRIEFHGLHDNPNWSVLKLFENGAPTEAAARFPLTMAAMAKADLTRIGIRAPTILFSRLAGGAKIPPHHGMMNARLICHLALTIPEKCGFRVGPDVRLWGEGKLLIFDDSVEHEVWNDSEEDRLVLIFDVWKPEVTADERKAIVAMFAAIDQI